MEMYSTIKPVSSERAKLGLSLAGGGFRAALFHLGVLRRMAKLDLLRHVEVLSTVSGGSIIGALYVLLLKGRLDKQATLGQQDYVDLVGDVQTILLSGIRKNLRTLLFMNPLGVLRVLTTSDSLGRRMGRIYERYIYQKAVRKLRKQTLLERLFRPGRIALRDLHMTPGGERITGGLEAYNHFAVKNRGSAVTNLVLNATTLNSGVPFYFTAAEIGDSRLGFVRHSEIKELMDYKFLLQGIPVGTLKAHGPRPVRIKGRDVDARKVSLAFWWRSSQDKGARPKIPDEWKPLFDLEGFPGKLAEAEFGQLRQMKLPAWYIRRGKDLTPPVDGGLSLAEHLANFWKGFEDIDEKLATVTRATAEADQNLRDLLLDFIVELYLMRSAEVVSGSIGKHWKKLRLGEAVGASACFPPVFPPMTFTGIYDDLHVDRLGMTDGGVYDNIGLSALLEHQCNYIIVSDTGGLFDIQQRSSAGRLGMSGRLAGILMDDVAGLQKSILRYRRRVAKGIEAAEGEGMTCPEMQELKDPRGLAFFHIQSPHIGDSGLPLNQDHKRLLAEIRTDLDGFGEVEITELINHGYDNADRYIREYLKDSPFAKDNEYWMPPDKAAEQERRNETDVEAILSAGKSRFFRALILKAPLSVVFTVLSIIVVIAGLWRVNLSLRDILSRSSKMVLNWIGSIPVLGRWTDYPLPLGFVFLAVAVAALVYWKMPSSIRELRQNRALKLIRQLITVKKWTRILVLKNVLFLFGLFPLVLSALSSVLSVISYLFYYLPFLGKTSNKG